MKVKQLTQNFPKTGWWVYHNNRDKKFGNLKEVIERLFESQQCLSSDIEKKEVIRICQHHGYFACGIEVIYFVPTGKKCSSDFYQ